MKKQFVSNSTRSTMTRFGFAFLLLMSLSQGFAHPVTKAEEPYLNIKYIGTVSDRAQFQVDMLNDAEESYLFAIQDQDGTILYKEKITKKAFTKTFAWDNTELASSKLIFSLTGEKSKKTQ